MKIFLLALKLLYLCIIMAVPLFILYMFSLYIIHGFDTNFLAIEKCENMKKTWDYKNETCK